MPAAMPETAAPSTYRLEDQVGHALRRAGQRHTAIFAQHMIDDLTPTQWAALVKVAELGSVSQNQLGRDTAMDAATIKGVVDRLLRRDLIEISSDPADARRSMISLTPAGASTVSRGVAAAWRISAETCGGLSESETQTLLDLLRRIA